MDMKLTRMEIKEAEEEFGLIDAKLLFIEQITIGISLTVKDAR